MKTTPEQRDELRKDARGVIFVSDGSRGSDRIMRVLGAVGDLLDDLDEAVEHPRDEFHTMDELYDYRMLYNAIAANAMPEIAVKSWRHSDGELCFGGGWFVVYLLLPTGQVSNHYKTEFWDLFKIPEAETAPVYDGHTPQSAETRLRAFVKGELS